MHPFMFMFSAFPDAKLMNFALPSVTSFYIKRYRTLQAGDNNKKN